METHQAWPCVADRSWWHSIHSPDKAADVSNHHTHAMLCASLNTDGHITGSQRRRTHCLHGSTRERELYWQRRGPTFWRQHRIDAACELQGFHESFAFLIKAQNRKGKNMTLSYLEPVIQTNMFMPWALSFQNSIKAALEVGNFNGRTS